MVRRTLLIIRGTNRESARHGKILASVAPLWRGVLLAELRRPVVELDSVRRLLGWPWAGRVA